MTIDEIRDALDGLYAYDDGCIDSGIKDERLRLRVYAAMLNLNREQIARLVRDMWLSDEAIEQGYGAEDAARFLEWLDERMGGYAR
jgi:hypothetical protein